MHQASFYTERFVSRETHVISPFLGIDSMFHVKQSIFYGCSVSRETFPS